MNGHWKFVFDKDRSKLTKYFRREITSPVYIRLYTVNKQGEITYFQMSGNDEPFSSIPVKDNELKKQIKTDFPFIQTVKLEQN